MQIPPPLRPGDRVRVVAPASPFPPDDLRAGLDVLRSWGLVPVVRDDLFERRAYLAGTVQRRVDELQEAFADPDCRAVLAARGGYGVTTLLRHLDPAPLVADPKPIVGCSDLTALLAWASGHGVAGLHGPMVAGLGRGDDAEGAAALRQTLFGAGAVEHRPGLPDAEAWCVAPGHARGVLVGGSLSLLAALCGTPWQPKTRGAIVLLEDVGERPYRIDRLLTQCEDAGLFDGAAAVVLGDFTGCEEPGLTWRDAVDRVFRRLPLPVLAGLPFGHGRPNLPLPIGARAEVDAGAGWLRLRDVVPRKA